MGVHEGGAGVEEEAWDHASSVAAVERVVVVADSDWGQIHGSGVGVVPYAEGALLGQVVALIAVVVWLAEEDWDDWEILEWGHQSLQPKLHSWKEAQCQVDW